MDFEGELRRTLLIVQWRVLGDVERTSISSHCRSKLPRLVKA